MLGPRPKLDPRAPKSIRLYTDLARLVGQEAERRGCSENEVILTAIEHEFLRMATYRLPYADGIRLMEFGQRPPCSRSDRFVLQSSAESD